MEAKLMQNDYAGMLLSAGPLNQSSIPNATNWFCIDAGATVLGLLIAERLLQWEIRKNLPKMGA